MITEPCVLRDPFNVLFYLSQAGPKFEIHMGLPDPLRSRNQPAESHLVQGQFGVLIVRNLILLLTQAVQRGSQGGKGCLFRAMTTAMDAINYPAKATR